MKTETNEQSHARWEREKEADQAAIQLGLAYREARHGVCYWDKHASEAFRAGFEAGKNAQLAAAQQGVPEGWQIAPIEPTPEMYDRVMREGYYHEDPEAAKAVLRAEYQDMLAAAPKPPATHPTQQGLDARTAYEAECFRWLRDEALKAWRAGPVVFMTDADGCPGDGGTWSGKILTGNKLESAIPVAAQVKQGGVANG